MKKTLTISLICFLLSGFIVKLNGQITVTKQNLQIEKQVDSVFHAMIKDAENLKYDKLALGVDDSYHSGFISNESYYMRFDSLITIAQSKSRGVTKQNITVEKEKITVLSDNIVLLTATGISKVDLNSGNSFSVKFFWSFVYERMNMNWRVIQSHQSNYR